MKTKSVLFVKDAPLFVGPAVLVFSDDEKQVMTLR